MDVIQCFNCAYHTRSDLPPRENVWRVGDAWRVALAFNSSLEGWAVVIPMRHIESLDELTDEESASLGILLRDLTGALKAVTGCLKTYVMLLAEMPGFNHVHFHVVPRMKDLPSERTGSAIFAYLNEDPLSDDARDEIALRIRGELTRAGSSGSAG
jgi:diadenosine tetraphosphate (Ap4A) HIT family hydrolase